MAIAVTQALAVRQPELHHQTRLARAAAVAKAAPFVHYLHFSQAGFHLQLMNTVGPFGDHADSLTDSIHKLTCIDRATKADLLMLLKKGNQLHLELPHWKM